MVTQVAIAMTALLAGVVLEHWITTRSGAPADPKPKRDTTGEIASQSPQKSDDSSVGQDSAQVAQLLTNSPASQKSLAQILKTRNSRERTKALEEAVSKLAISEFGAALKQLRQMPEGNARDLASRLLVARWTEIDPNGALQFAVQNHEFDYIANDVFQQLAADDIQTALARAQSITDPNVRYQALRGVLSYMADQDPRGALALAGTLGSFPNNEPLSQMIYRQWSSVDPQAAAAQASLEPAGDSWRSPAGQVLRNWASDDPRAAIAWSQSVTDPATQAHDIAQIFRQWSRDDLDAAANWVSSAPAGAMRDAAAASLALSMGRTDPSGAIGWAQSIADPTQRDNALQRLSREIMYRDPTNGATILQAAGVPTNLIPPPPAPDQPRGRRGR